MRNACEFRWFWCHTHIQHSAFTSPPCHSISVRISIPSNNNFVCVCFSALFACPSPSLHPLPFACSLALLLPFALLQQQQQHNHHRFISFTRTWGKAQKLSRRLRRRLSLFAFRFSFCASHYSSCSCSSLPLPTTPPPPTKFIRSLGGGLLSSAHFIVWPFRSSLFLPIPIPQSLCFSSLPFSLSQFWCCQFSCFAGRYNFHALPMFGNTLSFASIFLSFCFCSSFNC